MEPISVFHWNIKDSPYKSDWTHKSKGDPESTKSPKNPIDLLVPKARMGAQKDKRQIIDALA